jgi:hypothetical protein
MPIKYLEIGWGGSKIQELKFESILLTGESPVDKEISFLRKKGPKSDGQLETWLNKSKTNDQIGNGS